MTHTNVETGIGSFWVEACGHEVEGAVTARATFAVKLSCDSGPDDSSKPLDEHEQANVDKLEADLESFVEALNKAVFYNQYTFNSAESPYMVSDEDHEPYGDGESGVHTSIDRGIEVEFTLEEGHGNFYTFSMRMIASLMAEQIDYLMYQDKDRCFFMEKHLSVDSLSRWSEVEVEFVSGVGQLEHSTTVLLNSDNDTANLEKLPNFGEHQHPYMSHKGASLYVHKKYQDENFITRNWNDRANFHQLSHYDPLIEGRTKENIW